MDLVWGAVAEALAGPVVEDLGEAMALRLSESRQVRAFRQILPQQAMYRLIG